MDYSSTNHGLYPPSSSSSSSSSLLDHHQHDLDDEQQPTAHPSHYHPNPLTRPYPASRVLTQQESDRLATLDRLKFFLATAPSRWPTDSRPSSPSQTPPSLTGPSGSHSHPYLNRFLLPSQEYVSCVLWGGLYHITGTDIVRALVFRFEAFGRPVKNMKKFEEGVFSDLRNLKPGVDACLEEPKSAFLDLLFKYQCIRTQKKQKVFYWFSVPHDRLFLDALERDLKREKMGLESTTVITGEPASSFTYDPKRSLFEQFARPHAGGPDASPSGEVSDSSALSAIAAAASSSSSSAGHINPEISGDVSTLATGAAAAAASSSAENNSSQEAAAAAATGGAASSKPPSAMDQFISMHALFEGSPMYKQRRKKASASSAAAVAAVAASSSSTGIKRRELMDLSLPHSHSLSSSSSDESDMVGGYSVIGGSASSSGIENLYDVHSRGAEMLGQQATAAEMFVAQARGEQIPSGGLRERERERRRREALVRNSSAPAQLPVMLAHQQQQQQQAGPGGHPLACVAPALPMASSVSQQHQQRHANTFPQFSNGNAVRKARVQGFMCPLYSCGKAFTTAHALLNHVAWHTSSGAAGQEFEEMPLSGAAFLDDSSEPMAVETELGIAQRREVEIDVEADDVNRFRPSSSHSHQYDTAAATNGPNAFGWTQQPLQSSPAFSTTSAPPDMPSSASSSAASFSFPSSVSSSSSSPYLHPPPLVHSQSHQDYSNSGSLAALPHHHHHAHTLPISAPSHRQQFGDIQMPPASSASASFPLAQHQQQSLSAAGAGPVRRYRSMTPNLGGNVGVGRSASLGRATYHPYAVPGHTQTTMYGSYSARSSPSGMRFSVQLPQDGAVAAAAAHQQRYDEAYVQQQGQQQQGMSMLGNVERAMSESAMSVASVSGGGGAVSYEMSQMLDLDQQQQQQQGSYEVVDGSNMFRSESPVPMTTYTRTNSPGTYGVAAAPASMDATAAGFDSTTTADAGGLVYPAASASAVAVTGENGGYSSSSRTTTSSSPLGYSHQQHHQHLHHHANASTSSTSSSASSTGSANGENYSYGSYTGLQQQQQQPRYAQVPGFAQQQEQRFHPAAQMYNSYHHHHPFATGQQQQAQHAGL